MRWPSSWPEHSCPRASTARRFMPDNCPVGGHEGRCPSSPKTWTPASCDCETCTEYPRYLTYKPFLVNTHARRAFPITWMGEQKTGSRKNLPNSTWQPTGAHGQKPGLQIPPPALAAQPPGFCRSFSESELENEAGSCYILSSNPAFLLCTDHDG